MPIKDLISTRAGLNNAILERFGSHLVNIFPYLTQVIIVKSRIIKLLKNHSFLELVIGDRPLNSSTLCAAYMRRWTGSALVQAMTCRQAITWTNAGLLTIGPLGTNFTKIRTIIQNVSFTKIYLKMSSAKWRSFSSGEDELTWNTHGRFTPVLKGRKWRG